MVALGGDLALFLIGLSFASQATILPAFAQHLGASHVLIGAIPAVMTLGWFLPALFTAGHTAALPEKLPFVLRRARPDLSGARRPGQPAGGRTRGPHGGPRAGILRRRAIRREQSVVPGLAGS